MRKNVLILIAIGTLHQTEASPQDYKILGLEPKADLDALKAAYRWEALKSHPDTNADPQAGEMFINVSNAYERIKQKISQDPPGKIQGDAFKVFRDFMSGGSFTFSFSSGGGSFSGTSSSSSTVIRNGVKVTTTEVKNLASGRVETTVVEENLSTGHKDTRVIQQTINRQSNSVEL